MTSKLIYGKNLYNKIMKREYMVSHIQKSQRNLEKSDETIILQIQFCYIQNFIPKMKLANRDFNIRDNKILIKIF